MMVLRIVEKRGKGIFNSRHLIGFGKEFADFHCEVNMVALISVNTWIYQSHDVSTVSAP